MLLTTILNKTIKTIADSTPKDSTTVSTTVSTTENFTEKDISVDSAWAIIILALFIRAALVYFIVPFLWNESVKNLLSTKTKMTGRMAIALAVLLDFLL